MRFSARIISALAGCLFLIAGISGCADNTAKEEKGPIKIGVIFPRSGNNALLGEQAWIGADIARQMVNEAGGVKGRKVEFIEADGSTPAAAETEANRLIEKEKVNIIIGSLTSGNALAIGAVTEKNNTVLWETSAVSDDLTNKGYKYVFRTCDRGELRGVNVMKFIKEVIVPKLGIPIDNIKVALVNEDSSFGESQINGAKEEAKNLGINIVAHEKYNTNITDMSAMVLRIKESKPDVIFAISYIYDGVLFWNTLRQFNTVPKVMIGGGAGYTDLSFGKVQGDKAEGIYCVDMPANLPVTVHRDPNVAKLVEEFRSRYKNVEITASNPTLAAEVAFMGTYVLLNNVLPSAKSMSTKDIRQAAMGTKLAETSMAWSVNFGQDGQNSGAFSVVQQWRKGKTVIVWPEQLAFSK